ncbi:MAG: M81 family metallopeptidase [Alphaproteobacteria bacterium]|nr:M81 family metallopeptidase [Alphaproteobacteria bacterium]
MARIAVATFQHETNTFAPSKAGFAQFESGGGWPGYTVGAHVLEVIQGINIPIAGFVEAVRKKGHGVVPLVFANATPSAQVTDDAFERIAGDLVRQLELRASEIDAVYLDLHGAMVSERFDDGEGEILARVRRVVGDRVPVVASLDLHANVSEAMLRRSDGMVAYRTYPHVDMAETGARTASLLQAIFDRQERPHKLMRPLDFLIPLTAQSTLAQPCDRIYGELGRRETPAQAWLSFTPGFPAADVPCCGPAIFGMGFDRAALESAFVELGSILEAEERNFQAEFMSPDHAVRQAIDIARTASRPVILADTQDNPGAGGNGDTTGLLSALLTHRAPSALLGLLIDAPAARRAHEAGLGATVEFSLGAKSGLKQHFPVVGRFTVERLSTGEFTCVGPFYRGAQMQLGPMAALRKDGVTVVVASKKVQAADQEMFRHMTIDPQSFGIVALKSSVHFRAHFGPIAEKVIVVAAPGPMLADPAQLPWRRLRRGIRLKPYGPAFRPPLGGSA